MSTTTLLSVLLVSLFFLTSCDHPADEHGHAAHQSTKEDHAAALELTLNNGEKWPTDEHTRLSAARMATRVDGAANMHSRQDAIALAKDLDAELETLVAGCTMTGKAHDQLHVFLMALFPKVAALKEQTELAELQHTREEISSLFVAYAQHFEE